MVFGFPYVSNSSLSPRLATDLSPSLAGVRRRVSAIDLSTHLAIHVSPSLARQALRMFFLFPWHCVSWPSESTRHERQRAVKGGRRPFWTGRSSRDSKALGLQSCNSFSDALSLLPAGGGGFQTENGMQVKRVAVLPKPGIPEKARTEESLVTRRERSAFC